MTHWFSENIIIVLCQLQLHCCCHLQPQGVSLRRVGLQSRMSRKIAGNASDSSDSDDDDLLEILHDDKDDDFKPVKSQPGLYYKVNISQDYEQDYYLLGRICVH